MRQGKRSTGRWPLAPVRSQGSKLLLRCYAIEGRNWAAIPPRNVPLLLLLVHPVERTHQFALGFSSLRGPWCCESVQAPWVVVGWLPADGSLPFGEPDLVDPYVARLTFLSSAQRYSEELDKEPSGFSTTPHLGPISRPAEDEK